MVKGQIRETKKHAWANRLKQALESISDNSQVCARPPCSRGHLGEDKAGAELELMFPKAARAVPESPGRALPPLDLLILESPSRL